MSRNEKKNIKYYLIKEQEILHLHTKICVVIKD